MALSCRENSRLGLSFPNLFNSGAVFHYFIHKYVFTSSCIVGCGTSVVRCHVINMLSCIDVVFTKHLACSACVLGPLTGSRHPCRASVTNSSRCLDEAGVHRGPCHILGCLCRFPFVEGQRLFLAHDIFRGPGGWSLFPSSSVMLNLGHQGRMQGSCLSCQGKTSVWS